MQPNNLEATPKIPNPKLSIINIIKSAENKTFMSTNINNIKEVFKNIKTSTDVEDVIKNNQFNKLLKTFLRLEVCLPPHFLLDCLIQLVEINSFLYGDCFVLFANELCHDDLDEIRKFFLSKNVSKNFMNEAELKVTKLKLSKDRKNMYELKKNRLKFGSHSDENSQLFFKMRTSIFYIPFSDTILDLKSTFFLFDVDNLIYKTEKEKRSEEVDRNRKVYDNFKDMIYYSERFGINYILVVNEFNTANNENKWGFLNKEKIIHANPKEQEILFAHVYAYWPNVVSFGFDRSDSYCYEDLKRVAKQFVDNKNK